MSNQDYLKKSLVDFQNELETFKGLQLTLNEAKENLIGAERSWNESSAENKKSIKNIIEIVSGSVASAEIVNKSLANLCESLDPLVKSIEAVNFPIRLDKIDMAVSTQASTLASVHALQIHEFRKLSEENHLNSNSISDGFFLVNSKIDKRSLFIVFLLVIIVGLEALILFRNFN